MKKLLFGLLAVFILTGCHTSEKVLYMQDVVLDSAVVVKNKKKITVRPGDLISINVTCKEPQLSMMFNQMVSRQYMQNSIGTTSGRGTTIGASGGQSESVPYTVDEAGNIDFPILGELHVAGMDREGIAKMIKKRIQDGGYIEDPKVTVSFGNLKYNVIGEVKSPGTYYISNDYVTLMDALSQAGDLTIYGKRNAIYVTRTAEGKRTTTKVDITKADFYDSPVYYLQQDDVIYVEPNDTRAGQSTINDNNLKSVGMWMSIASFVMSVAVLIFK